MKRKGSSSKVVGKILIPAGHEVVRKLARYPGIHRIVLGENLEQNGTLPCGSITVVHVIDGGIKIRINDTDAAQEVFLANNNKDFETTFRAYLARRGKQ